MSTYEEAFHAGEQAMQLRAGGAVRERLAAHGRQHHSHFYAGATPRFFRTITVYRDRQRRCRGPAVGLDIDEQNGLYRRTNSATVNDCGAARRIRSARGEFTPGAPRSACSVSNRRPAGAIA